jgi:hypothetical protein
MLKKIARKIAVLGVLGFVLFAGAFAVSGATAPEAKARGCWGWNGIFLHINNCGGYGYPGYGYGGYPGYYPPAYPPPYYGPPRPCGC